MRASVGAAITKGLLLAFIATHALAFKPSDEVSHNPFKGEDLSSHISAQLSRFPQEESIRAMIRNKLRQYKAEVMEALDLPSNDPHQTLLDQDSLSRVKRATITADNSQLLGRRRRKIPLRLNDEGSYVIRRVFRASPQFFDHVQTVDINALVIRNETYIFTLEPKSSGTTQLGVYIVGSSLQPKEIARIEAPGAISLEIIKMDKLYYVLPLVYNWTHNNSVDAIDVGSTLYRVDLLRRTLAKVQTIRTAYARSSVFWKGAGADANDINLAIAPEYTETVKGRRYAVEVPCYRWQGGYFDYVSSVPANNPQSIRYFNIYSHDYLVISNYQDDSGSTNIHSEVFKYLHKESRFVSFQRIRTYGAKDIEHFSFRSGERVEHFLAVANHCQRDENGELNYRVKSFIMKFASQRFIPFKSFYTYGALQVLPVTLEEKFYLVILEKMGIRIFQYNGWTFVQTHKTDLPDLGSSFYSLKLRGFPYENEPYFAVASVGENFQGGVYSVQFDQRHDYSKLTSSLEKWCLAAKGQMDKVNITQLEVDLNLAPKIDDSQLLLSQPLTLAAPLKLSHLSAKTMKYGGVELNGALAQSLSQQWTQLNELSKLLPSLVAKMKEVVYRNGNHVISSRVVFEELEYKGNALRTRAGSVGDLNGIQIPKLLPLLLYTNKDLNFSALQIQSLILKEDLNVSQLNGSPLSDYALKNSQSSLAFDKKNTFLKEVTAILGLKVTGDLDKVNFHNPNFLLAQGNQTFQGLVRTSNCTFKDLFTKWLNGVDVEEYFKDAVPLHGDALITGSKTFTEITIQNFDTQAPLNGLDLKSVQKNTIRISGRESQAFTGRTRFRNLIAEDVVLKNELVNGKYDLQNHFVNINFGNYSLSEVQFLDHTFIKDLTILQKLNRISVVDGELDLLLKDSLKPQIIKNKRLQGLHFESDVRADRLVDGVNLKDWLPERRILLRNSQFYKNYTIFGKLSVPKGIRIKNRFRQGSRDILPILKNIALLNSTKLPGTCSLTFETLVVEGNTDIRKDINGVQPNSWIHKNYPGSYNISGVKNFFGPLFLEEDCIAKALFGSRNSSAENILKAIPNLLLDKVDQTIFGDTAFLDLLQVNNLYCPNVVLDNVPFENIMLKKGDQIIDVETYFKSSVKFEGPVTVNGRMEVGSVNGLNLTEEIQDTLRTGNISTTQVIQGEYTFRGGFNVDMLETDGLVGGYNLGNLFASIIRKDRTEGVKLENGSISFEKGLHLNSLEYTGQLNGINDTQWGKLWLLSSGDQTVYTDVEFKEDLIVDEGFYVENERVGEVDVVRMNKEILRRDKGGSLGRVVFHGEVEVNKTVEMSPGATVNEINLRTDVLLRNSPNSSEQVVSGEKTFEYGWTIDGNLRAKDLDGLNLSHLLRFLFDANSDGFKNDTLVIKGNLQLNFEPEVTHSVNGLKLREIIKDVWFTNKDVLLKHKIDFEEILLEKGGLFSKDESKLSGVNLNELNNNYISKRRDQSWSGSVLLERGVDFEHLQVKDLFLNQGLFNGVNLTNFFESILRNGTEQIIRGQISITKLQANHIDLDHGVLINGLNVTSDLVTLHGLNLIKGKKHINYLLVHDLVLGGETLLSGVNMTVWKLNSVKTVGNNEISLPIDLNNFEATQDIRVDGLVDGVQFDADHILLTRGNQTIVGEVKIIWKDGETAALTAPQGIIVHGPFNNYDLNSTFSSLALKSEENETSPLVIEGRKVILAPIYVHHLRTEKLYQGLNLTKLLNDFYTGLIIPHNLTFKAKERYQALTDFTTQVGQIGSHFMTFIKIYYANPFYGQGRAVFLEYFVFTQEIIQQSLYTKILYGTRSPTLVIGFQKSKYVVTEDWWSYSLTTDYYQRELGNRIRIQGKVVGYKELETDFGVFVIISISSVNKRPVELTLGTEKSSTYSEVNKGNAMDFGKSGRSGNMSKTFIVKSSEVGAATGTSEITQVIEGKDFGALQVLRIFSADGVQDCLLLISLDSQASSGDILCLDTTTGQFKPYQTIPLQYPIFATSMEAMNTTFVLIATSNKIIEAEGIVEVWSHSGGLQLLKKESCIPVYNFKSMDAVFGSNIIPFVAIASGALPTSRYSGSVFVYRYSMVKREFEKMQTLEIESPLQVRLFSIHPVGPSAEVFLFVLNDRSVDNFLVFKYQGMAGWILEHKWTSEGAKSFELADFEMEGVYKAQVLVSSANGTRIYSAEFKGLSSRAPLEWEGREEP